VYKRQVLKNPVPFLDPSADIAFQRDWIYPKPMVDAWGLAACTGFVCFRNRPQVHAFLASARAFNETYYSDQVAFNFALQATEPVWHWPDTARPVTEKSVFKRTAAESILGTASDESLIFQALPADAFYRHYWIPYRRRRLVVYHPNLHKDVAFKARYLSDFQFLGHYYARLRKRMRGDRG